MGTEDEPFQQRAVITLHGSPVSKEIPLYGAAVIGCRECTLDLHGKPTVRAWTYLAATAAAGDTELVLEEPVHDWAPDGAAPVMVMVTSTAANGTMEEAETCVLLGVDGTGTRLTLSAPLLYDHLGQTFPLDGGHAVTFRANVALLSRNVVVQGSADMCHSTSTAATSCCTRGGTARSPTARRASHSSGGLRISR